MSHATEPTARDWTAADLVERFGPIPLCRVRGRPAPGAATEQDVIELVDHENKLCELVDGVLLEKAVGTYESYLAMRLGRLLGNFVEEQRLGIVLGADGMIRLAPGLVRIPDVSFIAIERLPDREVSRSRFARCSPSLDAADRLPPPDRRAMRPPNSA